MDNQIFVIAERIKEMRMLCDFTVEEMAQATNCTVDEYLRYESGKEDFYFNFLFKCANKFGIDIAELVTGEVPRLSFYTICRKGHGMPIERQECFSYNHLAYLLKDRLAEPFLVTAKYDEANLDKPVPTSVHPGQEFIYVIQGRLKARVDNHVEILEEGDSMYYDATHEHGMIAIDGSDCYFLAVVIKGGESHGSAL